MQGITILDIILSAILLYFLVTGYRKGLIKQISLIFGLLLAVFFALEYYPLLEGFLEPYLDVSTPVLQFLSFGIILILVNVLVQILAGVLRNMMEIIFLDPVDRLAGAGLGFIKGGILIYLFIVLLNNIPHEALEKSLESSVLASNFLSLTPIVQQNMKEFFEAH
ncbi:MAG: CvpA family protein [Bacillota bacterium]